MKLANGNGLTGIDALGGLLDALENDVSEIKSDVKLLLQHFKIDS